MKRLLASVILILMFTGYCFGESSRQELKGDFRFHVNGKVMPLGPKLSLIGFGADYRLLQPLDLFAAIDLFPLALLQDPVSLSMTAEMGLRYYFASIGKGFYLSAAAGILTGAESGSIFSDLYPTGSLYLGYEWAFSRSELAMEGGFSYLEPIPLPFINIIYYF